MVMGWVKMDNSCCDMAPPTLGQHTEEVLGQLLGQSVADIAALRARGIV